MKILEFDVFLYFELYLDFDFCAKWAVFSEPVTYIKTQCCIFIESCVYKCIYIKTQCCIFIERVCISVYILKHSVLYSLKVCV